MSEYKLSPHSTGKENSMALQALCDKGGTVRVTEPGVYELDRTIFLSSNTEVIFSPGVYIKRVKCTDAGVVSAYVFVNKGAFTREYDHDITIRGLNLICNGIEARGNSPIVGLISHVSFFYVKRLRIYDLECMDLLPGSFCIQICTFEDAVIERVHIEGRKDAIHFGRGEKFVVRHGIFRTFDDPIALNAHDYTTSNPQLGWIKDGIIEDCWDLDDKDTTGFFARILAGSWCDWRQGMPIRRSDTVVSNGRLYRSDTPVDGKEYISNTQPTHTEGVEVLDGIPWVMVQDDVIYNCGCENITFRDIHLQKKRSAALSIHFDDDAFSRSYYPGSQPPVQKNLVFENITCENEITALISSKTAFDCVKLINSTVGSSKIWLKQLDYPELEYPVCNVLINGTTFFGGESELIRCEDKRSLNVSIVNSISMDDEPRTYTGKVNVKACDINLINKED